MRRVAAARRAPRAGARRRSPWRRSGLEVEPRRQVQIAVRGPGVAIDAAMLAAAIRVDRQVEPDVGRVVARQDRSNRLLDDVRLGRPAPPRGPARACPSRRRRPRRGGRRSGARSPRPCRAPCARCAAMRTSVAGGASVGRRHAVDLTGYFCTVQAAVARRRSVLAAGQSRGQVVEARQRLQEDELEGAGGAVALLADDDLGEVRFLLGSPWFTPSPR